jgi:hypothetical protein
MEINFSEKKEERKKNRRLYKAKPLAPPYWNKGVGVMNFYSKACIYVVIGNII